MKLTPTELKQLIQETAAAISEGILAANEAGSLSLRHPEFIEVQAEIIMEDGLNAIERTEESTGGTKSSTSTDPSITRRSVKKPVEFPDRVQTETSAESTEESTQYSDSRRTESGVDTQVTTSQYDS